MAGTSQVTYLMRGTILPVRSDISIYSYTLLVFVFVCLYPLNVKTAEPIEPKIVEAICMTAGKVYGWSKLKYSESQINKYIARAHEMSSSKFNLKCMTAVMLLVCTKRKLLRCSQLQKVEYDL